MKIYIGYTKNDKRCLEKNPKWHKKINNAEIFTPCSLTDPVFIVDQKLVESSTNYVWCNDFNRFYYVNDIVLDGQVAYIHCHVDVLMSYQSGILSLKANVARQENDFNEWYADEKILTTSKRRVHIYDCGSTPFSTTGGGRPVVLTVSGGVS